MGISDWFRTYPFAEAEDAVDEDDGRRRGVEDDGRVAPALVALPRGGDVDERSSLGRARARRRLRGCGRRAAQQEATRRRGRLRDVGGDGRAEDVETEEHVHGGADPELHQAQDEPRHLVVPATTTSARAAVCRWSSLPSGSALPSPAILFLLLPRQEEEQEEEEETSEEGTDRKKDRSRPPDWAAAASAFSPPCGAVSFAAARCRAALSVVGRARARARLVVGAERRPEGRGVSLPLAPIIRLPYNWWGGR